MEPTKPACHRTLQKAALGGIALVSLVLLGLRLGLFPFPAHGVFGLVLVLAVLPSLFWWSWIDSWLADGRQTWTRWTWALYVLLTLSPMLGVTFRGRHAWDALPVPVIMWIMIWHILLMALGSLAVAVWLILGVLRWPGHAKPAKPTTHDDHPARVITAQRSKAALSRRALLMQAAFTTPLLVTAGASVAGMRGQGRFMIRHQTIQLPRLPKRLRGFTITQISDIHVGRIFRPKHLSAVVEAANRLNSDMVAITGDILDHNIEYLPATMEAIAALKHRYGRFIVAGNHDLLDSRKEFLEAMRKTEPGFLSDEHTRIKVGGETVRVAGLFWSRYEQPILSDPGLNSRAVATLKGGDPETFTIALAHHPHAFEALADHGADLILAGHTHGGQLMLTPPGFKYPIGGGSLLFRYIWGEYRRHQAALFVSAGVGNWFPVRLNAPAEIVQIRLV
ncbi:MAG: metallophosphoesterase [Phycisphaerae bacterium]|nr:metallophosphoesterase [Phycisphaerae bacterium]